MNLADIKDAIQAWERIKDTDEALRHLTSGFGFDLFDDAYVNWNKDLEAESYYVYLGLYEEQLMFFVSSALINKVNDPNQILSCNFHRSPLLEKESPSLLGSLSPTIAKDRIVNWLLGCNYWFNECRNKDQKIVSYFIVPAKDINDLFEDKGVFRICFLLALNFKEVKELDITNYIELLLIGESRSGNTITYTAYKDVTRPKPPFSD